jgi:DNA (cytosine-5)-methyltransferase 1
LDLFAGAGGFSDGFRQSGRFEVAAAVEIDEAAASTYHTNHPRTRLSLDDVCTLGKRQLHLLTGGPVDLVIGGPPCQGFSVSNGQRDPSHPSADLLLEFVRVVQELKPSAFVIENVPGLLSYRGGLLVDRVIRELNTVTVRRRRYKVVLDTLDAAAYGVPQHRRRIFIVGVRGEAFRFPAPGADRISLIDAIGDLPEWTAPGPDEAIYLPKSHPLTSYQSARRRDAAVLLNHSAKRLERRRQERVACLQEGDDKRVLPEHLQAGGRASKYRKLRSSVPSPTILAHMAHDTSGFIHPRYERMLTVREAARLQSFDDTYKFSGSQFQQFKQVGNAVPPVLARALAVALAGALDAAGVQQRAAHANRREVTTPVTRSTQPARSSSTSKSQSRTTVQPAAAKASSAARSRS